MTQMSERQFRIFYENHRGINEPIAGIYEYVTFATKEEAQKVIDDLSGAEQYFVLYEDGKTEEEARKYDAYQKDRAERYTKALDAKKKYQTLIQTHYKELGQVQEKHRKLIEEMETNFTNECQRLVSIMNLSPGV
jgi:hypothetical protein